MNNKSSHLFITCLSITLLLAALTPIACSCGGKKVSVKEPSMKPVPEIPVGEKMTYNDVLYGEYATDMALSPDGRHVAWIKEFATPGMKTRACNVFLTSTDSGATEQLTYFESAQVGLLKWAPDGSAFGFITDAPLPDGGGGAVQVWLAGPEVEGARPLTEAPTGVEGFDWKGPGAILYNAEVEGKDRSGAVPGDRTVRVTDFSENPVRLFEQSLAGGGPRQITDNQDRMLHLDVSPDGRQAFFVRTKSVMEEMAQTYSGDIPFTNHLMDLETGRQVEVFASIVRNGGTAWSPDSKTLYAVDMEVGEESLFVYRATVRTRVIESGKEGLVGVDWGNGLELMFPFGLPGGPLHTLQDGFLAFMADGCNPVLTRFTDTGNGWDMEALEGEDQGNIFVVGVSGDGKTLCYDHSEASKPPQLYSAGLSGTTIGRPRQITSLNPGFDSKSFTRSETVQWEGALGDAVEGLLFYPSGYQPGKKYPLVMVIHGGPFECDKDRWQTYQWIDPYHILSQKQAFVLAPNYHGSTGYGTAFAKAILDGAFYGVVNEDIEKGIGWLVGLGLVDEQKLGTMGWSCGSIISNSLIATDQRFKAASCGAGGAEWVSEWGQSMFGDLLAPELFGADPVEDPNVYKQPSQAPFYEAARVETPVIMFQPESDVNVAPCMTWITYRGIQKHSDAPVELYIFPGEGHVMSGLAHQRRKMTEEQKWFDRYLFKR